MLENIGDILTGGLSLLTGGAAGGVVGAISAIWKSSQENKLKIELERLNNEREAREYDNAKSEREHQAWLVTQGHANEMDKIKTETDAELDIATMQALQVSSAAEFGDLNTTSAMDNYRASVRPTVAYWSVLAFNVMLCWAFSEFSDQINESAGLQILLGLFATLNFTVASVISFYYVSRNNRK
mgnify:CR=1 FL=1